MLFIEPTTPDTLTQTKKVMLTENFQKAPFKNLFFGMMLLTFIFGIFQETADAENHKDSILDDSLTNIDIAHVPAPEKKAEQIKRQFFEAQIQ